MSTRSQRPSAKERKERKEIEELVIKDLYSKASIFGSSQQDSSNEMIHPADVALANLRLRYDAKTFFSLQEQLHKLVSTAKTSSTTEAFSIFEESAIKDNIYIVLATLHVAVDTYRELTPTSSLIFVDRLDKAKKCIITYMKQLEDGGVDLIETLTSAAPVFREASVIYQKLLQENP
jgi:hypothetical protein